MKLHSPIAVTMFPAVLLAAGCVLVSGCAGMARGVEQSVYRETAVVEPVEQAPANATALVVIRYPAMIHADAVSLYVSSFAVNAIGGTVPYNMYGNPQTERIAQSVIAKSGYYAMSMYRELKEQLPEHTVLLSPHIILWDEESRLHSRPILASEQVPAVLTLDFGVYSYPDVNEMMDAPPVTFGDLVTPLVVIKSSRWAMPSLNGLLLASEPLIESAWRLSRQQAERQFDARLDGGTDSRPVSLDFVSFLAERDAVAPELPVNRAGGRDGERIAIEQYPLEKIQMDRELVARVDEEGASDPFARDFVRGASARIVELLNGIDHERATFFARRAALARFDPELARVFFVQSGDESVRARLQLAEALVAAEREFLAAQSDSVYAGTYVGDFGVKMRKIIAAEYRMLEERRRLARRQNMTTAVAALALAGSVYGATVSTTASAAAVATFSGVSLMGSIWAMNKALDTKSESEEVNEYFIARMAPTFERQMAVQMEWLESKELITARGFAEFRNKTLTLYQSRVRSMQVRADERCAFRHPDFPGEGRWYGVCSDGLAEGTGYGLVRTGEGRTVEYLGAALAGLASGTGAMISGAGAGAGAGPVYYEGGFRAGRPDGAVRVEVPGGPPRLRRFESGRDVGRGDPGALRTLSFAISAGPGALANQ